MEKIIVNKATTTKNYTFVGEELNVQGEVVFDEQTKTVNVLNGSFYEKADAETGLAGNYIGSFDGYYVEGNIKFTIHDMTAENAARVTNLIVEVNTYVQDIINTDAAEEVAEEVAPVETDGQE